MSSDLRAAAGCAMLMLAQAPAAQGGVTLLAKPLAREQVAAFYAARGFAPAAIAPYGQACALSLTFRNEGAVALRARLADWRAEDGTRLRVPSEWETAWEKAGVPPAARIAFRWAQFPAEQEFAAGDWIMGMATPARRIKGPFRVIARYADDKGEHETVSNAVNCGD